ncbi:hypothetical protein Dgeo_2914 (plasmid) [Deinococcus geothermalis DSM 11300]|uniref:SH3 domain-containing protein n=1 Tax=Deinococcus geothermalis (strain DSM 11300 / CIP 105573 / AG-3a) TaxID=319795 RepID=A8ZR48_DEIGD|nr:hypothetical protein Dgeo_2914 [Deinococcus geothermalis DSM 11300]
MLSGLTAFQTSEFERFQRTTRLITDLAASAVRSAAPLVQSSDLLKGAGIGTLPRLPGLSPVWLGALEASQATKLARYSGLDPKTFSALQVILDQTQRAGLRLAVQDSSTVLALERLVTHLPDLPKEQTNLAEEEAARAMPAAIEATETDLFAELETRLEHLEAHVSTPWYRDAETLLQILLTVIFWAVPAPGDTAFEQQVQGGQQQALTRAGQIEDRLAQIERLLREQRAAEKEVTFIVKERPVAMQLSFRPHSPTVLRLQPGTQARLLAQHADWIKVEVFDERTGVHRFGWCLKKYLQRVRN